MVDKNYKWTYKLTKISDFACDMYSCFTLYHGKHETLICFCGYCGLNRVYKCACCQKEIPKTILFQMSILK